MRVPRSSGGALCLAGGEGEGGGARSSTFGWRVVKRAGIGGGSALIDMVVAFCLAGGEEWWKRAHRYARDVCIWRGGEWWCGGWGRAHRFTGGALCLAGWRGRRARRLSGGVCALIVGWRCFGFWAGGEGEVVARIDIRVAFVCVNRGGWWGGSGGGARSSIVGWRVCVWRVGRGGGGCEGGGGARSTLLKWRVGVWRAGRDGGGAPFGWRCVCIL